MKKKGKKKSVKKKVQHKRKVLKKRTKQVKARTKNVEDVTEARFESYEKSIPKLLDSANFKQVIKDKKRIFLKPNLTLCKAFPTTTDPIFVEQVLKCIKRCNKKAEIIIAEGSGGCSTEKCFRKLGYGGLCDKYKIPFLDLNETETKKIQDKKFKRFREIYYPEPLLTGFVISLPVLKGHHIAKVTISLKNMLGAFPSKYYKGERYSYKSVIHKWPIQYSIHDILVCKFPNYAICDASIAQLEHEINGYNKELNTLLAGKPLEVDKRGAFLLGHDWKRIPHLVLAEELKNNKLKVKIEN